MCSGVALALSCALLLAGVAVASDKTAVARAQKRDGTFKVLFIGNSHLFVNNVPGRVRNRLRSTKGSTAIRTFAYGGARLISFTQRGDVAAALKGTAWNVVVLQEATASFLSSRGRQNFHQAIKWFRRRVPVKTRIVLYQTWPWRTGSRFLRGRGSSATQLWQVMRREYAKVERNAGVIIAPVGTCWVRSPQRGTYYSADGNHATVAGSNVAASVIARTIVRGRRGGC